MYILSSRRARRKLAHIQASLTHIVDVCLMLEVNVRLAKVSAIHAVTEVISGTSADADVSGHSQSLRGDRHESLLSGKIHSRRPRRLIDQLTFVKLNTQNLI